MDGSVAKRQPYFFSELVSRKRVPSNKAYVPVPPSYHGQPRCGPQWRVIPRVGARAALAAEESAALHAASVQLEKIGALLLAADAAAPHTHRDRRLRRRPRRHHAPTGLAQPARRCPHPRAGCGGRLPHPLKRACGRVTTVLGARAVILVHHDGWSHLSEASMRFVRRLTPPASVSG
jgi:hypothetical protein